MLVLDYLRFLAIFGVIAFHLHDTVTYGTPWFSGGYLGVDIFLFLSGYFIERSIDGIRDRGFVSASGYFFSRRLLRIMVPMLVVTAVVGGFAYSQNISLWQDMLYSSLFVYNFYLVFHHIPYFQVYSTPHPFIGMWFIALLVQLYIVHFFLARVIKSITVYRLILIILGAVSIGGTWLLIQQDHTDMAYVLPWHAFSYIGGALTMSLAGRSAEGTRDRSQDLVVFIAVIALFLLMLLSPYRGFVFYSLATVVLTALFVVAAPQAPLLQGCKWTVLGTLGEMSYSLYLWNVPVIAFIHYFYPQNPIFVSVGLSLILILILSLITYHAIERPLQSLFGKAPRHRAEVFASAPMVILLLLAGWGWYALADALSQNVVQREQMQHDALYRDYLLRQVSTLQQQIRQAHHAASVARELSKDQWVQWQPTPRPGYLYDGKELRSNPDFPEKKVLFISDSILLGWSGYVVHQVPDGILNGKVGRSFFRATPVLKDMLSLPENRHVRDIVVELGSNGYVEWRDLEAFIQAAGDRQIFLVVPSVPRPWAAEVRETYLRAEGSYPNVHLIHWDEISRDHYNYFVADQVHLTWDGAQALMRAILESLWQHGYRLPSTPTVKPAEPMEVNASTEGSINGVTASAVSSDTVHLSPPTQGRAAAPASLTSNPTTVTDNSEGRKVPKTSSSLGGDAISDTMGVAPASSIP